MTSSSSLANGSLLFGAMIRKDSVRTRAKKMKKSLEVEIFEAQGADFLGKWRKELSFALLLAFRACLTSFVGSEIPLRPNHSSLAKPFGRAQPPRMATARGR